ncbi:MAG: zinc-ribbon domain-containing protein [Planctomycetota bacterium]|jgi:prepilin-type processing-associated H-X9-DG protein
MFCPKCGTQNPEGAQICQNCSSPLLTAPTQPQISTAKTSGLAITCFVLALIAPFTCAITILPAIIIGIIALVQISKRPEQIKGNGFAIAGVSIAAVMLFLVIPMLMAVLLPALARTGGVAYRMVCGTNLSGLGKTMLVYTNDNDGNDINERMFSCHGDEQGPCSYAINKNIENLTFDNAPPDMVLLFEATPGWNQVGGPELLTAEHHYGEGCNILYVDGHVEFVRPQDLDKLKWTPE